LGLEKHIEEVRGVGANDAPQIIVDIVEVLQGARVVILVVEGGVFEQGREKA
jgi:hypothetical protein